MGNLVRLDRRDECQDCGEIRDISIRRVDRQEWDIDIEGFMPPLGQGLVEVGEGFRGCVVVAGVALPAFCTREDRSAIASRSSSRSHGSPMM